MINDLIMAFKWHFKENGQVFQLSMGDRTNKKGQDKKWFVSDGQENFPAGRFLLYRKRLGWEQWGLARVRVAHQIHVTSR